ncbi:MAG: glutamine-hydrolyzing GMP synthase [archaeon]
MKKNAVKKEKIAILDAGSQFGKIIDRRVRELNIESDILPINTSVEILKKYGGIIISGGPESVYEKTAPKCDKNIFSLGIPILGICYGMQLINYIFGGTVHKKDLREDGACKIKIFKGSNIFFGLSKKETVLMSHGDSINKVANGFKIIANSDNIVAAIENPEKKLYGLQFHPEVDITLNGKIMLKNFLYKISGLKANYSMENREEKAIREIRTKVKNNNVLVLVSGGVDSTVCVALLKKALGSKKVFAVHVDNGFMRLNESKNVKKFLTKQGIKLDVIDAKEEFYSATTTINKKETKQLRKTIIPEEKRKIIGDTFIKVAERHIKQLGLNSNNTFLVQGTLRPDLIESASEIASKNADVIKTHHNDTSLVRELRKKGRIIEPLKDYHKDEVRKLGEMIGLPKELVWRQPFPGPGLAVRIICAEKAHVNSDFEKINNQLMNFSTKNIFATILPIQTVGVQGDGRTYSYLVGLSGEENWNKLFEIANKIPKKIHKVNRIVYVFGKKIINSIKEITPTHPTIDVIKKLQIADDIVNQTLLEFNLLKKLSQVPVILFPVNFGIENNHSIAIRTFITNDFMTGVPAIPGKDIPKKALKKIVKRILKEVPDISRVVYDLTSKPPGTTEWE